MGPLAGVTVLDLTSVLMGPFATQILGDMGADVIKIEMPGGDILRHNRPARHPDMPGQFLNLNRNKRSIVLDLKQESARAALMRLVDRADVLIHNLRPRAIADLGITAEVLRERNPRLIYCAARGFSEAGPYGDKAAYDDLIQAGSGLCTLLERVTGTPAYVPTAMCDKIAGQAIVYAVTAALFARERSGLGESIEVPMFEVNVAFNLAEHLAGFAFEPAMAPFGYGRLVSRFRKPYRTADGYIALLPYTDRNWARFFEFIERPELAADARFRDVGGRIENIDILYALVEEAAAQRTTRAWVEFCDEASIPAMPVRAPEALWSDPHLVAIGFFETAEHPSEGPYKSVGFPIGFAEHPTKRRRHAPRLAQHTREVLREAGFSEAEIDALAPPEAAPTTLHPQAQEGKLAHE